MSTIRMREVDPEADADLLHAWVTADRARFWGMQEETRDGVRDIYTYIGSQPHLSAHFLEVAGEDRPLALLQTYDPAVEEIGRFYDRRPGDLGIHALLPDDPARSGRTPELVAFAMEALFARDGVRRIVLEPDVANEKSVALAEALGAERGPRTRVVTSYLDKEAQFFFLTLEAWRATAERWATGGPSTSG
ncbi:acetyltransferase [Nocardioides panacisoli]|uniref:GNAT family N-acetyltransferase n=1 Tax=Nocardioides panacisoli TaxID=627624 RepID=UPI001C62976E|nr:GNAT family N-acetyltransferase [Nocardioides panacisoli]QYJ05106.1 acetyltransferase [Nocardioides panacisoli]